MITDDKLVSTVNRTVRLEKGEKMYQVIIQEWNDDSPRQLLWVPAFDKRAARQIGHEYAIRILGLKNRLYSISVTSEVL